MQVQTAIALRDRRRLTLPAEAIESSRLAANEEFAMSVRADGMEMVRFKRNCGAQNCWRGGVLTLAHCRLNRFKPVMQMRRKLCTRLCLANTALICLCKTKDVLNGQRDFAPSRASKYLMPCIGSPLRIMGLWQL
jgi:hypothetical protein